jgi:hypothetical protein
MDQEVFQWGSEFRISEYHKKAPCGAFCGPDGATTIFCFAYLCRISQSIILHGIKYVLF